MQLILYVRETYNKRQILFSTFTTTLLIRKFCLKKNLLYYNFIKYFKNKNFKCKQRYSLLQTFEKLKKN